MQETTKQIETIKKVILKCYEISKSKEFKGINLSLCSDETVMSRIKQGFKLIDYVDTNSETYNSILTCAKMALIELKTEKYEYYYWYLIQLFCTVQFDKIVNKKSIKVEMFSDKKERFTKEEEKIGKPINDKEKHIKENVTGSKLSKIKEENKEMNDWEFELDEEEIDEEYDESEDNEMEM